MTPIAHVSGVPVEELLPLAYGAGAIWIAVRAYASVRVRSLRRRLRRR